MTAETHEIPIRSILSSFINDPPDSDYQRGFLGAILMIANEYMGIRYDDPLWQAADCLLTGDDPNYAAAARERAKRKLERFAVIEGGLCGND